ncbi:ATP-grasp domain-containing protein [Siminovitchia fortis]|uniref:ATP-grasp domain-containing protein n=1 Tax=Siminovitchia fortis TaxID=254758 RepID=A0A451GC90_9BACI|nr:ATP-grasp domain-containing protein [Siminovitchia fortis]RWR12840.1 ATP-grasp domain-containing protein [Siminovitchia fortis]WHY80508.1 ATP-grasp domain-containing protein [Siminovitchia fortis]
MNILICSVGRRVKLIQYFKEELHKVGGKVIAADCDETAAALYHADMYEVAPRIDHPDYIPYIKKLCEKYSIKGVLSLIDPELSLLTGVKEEFKKDGIMVIVSDKNVVDICFDKYSTYAFLQANNIPSVPTYIDMDAALMDLNKNQLKFPLIIKPRNGSASMGINKVNNLKELEPFKAGYQDYIIQPYMDCEEYGADCYIDVISKETINIFLKRKVKMRAGETDKSIAVKDPMFKQVVEKLIGALNPLGPIDIDCFKTENGYAVSEINPRFGGGYLHAHEMGQNFVKNIINNIQGATNAAGGDYEEGTTMVKYDHVMVI